jgi:hypothetical protein
MSDNPALADKQPVAPGVDFDSFGKLSYEDLVGCVDSDGMFAFFALRE